MTLQDRVRSLPPDRYARGAQAAARLAKKAALRTGRPVPDEVSRILNKSLDELADDVRAREAARETAASDDVTPGSVVDASDSNAGEYCVIASNVLLGPLAETHGFAGLEIGDPARSEEFEHPLPGGSLMRHVYASLNHDRPGVYRFSKLDPLGPGFFVGRLESDTPRK